MPNKQPKKNHEFLSEFLNISGWSINDYFREQVEVADGFTINLCGLSAKNAQGALVTGSAGERDDDPALRAQYELLERILLFEAASMGENGRNGAPQVDLQGERLELGINSPPLFPDSGAAQQWQYAKSNGVACHSNWRAACTAAALELVERELVLASWLGQSKPLVSVPQVGNHFFEPISHLYEPVLVDFGQRKLAAWDEPIAVQGIFLFPKNVCHPLVYGFGSGFSEELASKRARTEACQRLGFLWGEAIPSALPDFQAHPLYHQEFYLFPHNHALLRSWLAGEWFTAGSASSPASLEVKFFDLSPKQFTQFRLAKVLSPHTTPLTFGQCDRFAYAALPAYRKIHPIF